MRCHVSSPIFRRLPEDMRNRQSNNTARLSAGGHFALVFVQLQRTAHIRTGQPAWSRRSTSNTLGIEIRMHVNTIIHRNRLLTTGPRDRISSSSVLSNEQVLVQRRTNERRTTNPSRKPQNTRSAFRINMDFGRAADTTISKHCNKLIGLVTEYSQHQVDTDFIRHI